MTVAIGWSKISRFRFFRPFKYLIILFFLPFLLASFLPADAQAAQVTLAWDLNANPGVTGYKLHYGTQSRNYSFSVDVGNSTSSVVPTLQAETTYYFAVTAYDAAGVESGFSNEVVYTAPAVNPGAEIEILWRNGSTGENAIWTMGGVNLISSQPLMTQSNTNWKIVGRGDFDYDGKTDILWRNTSTGQNAVWYMNGTTLVTSAVLPTVNDLNWTIVATGDFDYDGKTDILWRNTSTGHNAIWYMDGTTITRSAALLTVPNTNWKVVGTADFNGDGKVDILWRNTATGENAYWYMNGTTVEGQPLPTVNDLNWTIVGTADFNGDGKVDILWRNTSTGQNGVWYMNNRTYTGFAWLLTVPDTNWKVAGL